MKKLAYICLAVPLIWSCAAGQSGPKKPKVEGNWQWQQSSGGFAGRTTTPESSNQSRHLQITKDSIFSYQNGELLSAMPYSLKYGKIPMMSEESWYYDEGDQIKVAVIRQDSLLILKENCADCFEHRYVKMKEK